MTHDEFVKELNRIWFNTLPYICGKFIFVEEYSKELCENLYNDFVVNAKREDRIYENIWNLRQ